MKMKIFVLIKLMLLIVCRNNDGNKIIAISYDEINIIKRLYNACKNEVINKIDYFIVVAKDFALLKEIGIF